MSDERRAGTGRDDDEALEALARRIAVGFRAPETLDAGFESRLMAEARPEIERLYARTRPSERPRESIFWALLKPRTVHVSPLGALALAAGFAGIVAIGTLQLDGLRVNGERPATAVAGPTTHDTIEVVRFVFMDQGASQVALVGDFNGWDAAAVPLEAAGTPGAWTVSVPLPAGRHEYAFIVDGKRWAPDPFAPQTTDEFQTTSSVITVGE